MIKEHYSSWVPKLFGAGAITLMPLGIFYKWSADEIKANNWHFVRRHESQHVIQYRRMGFFGFYLTYLWQALTHGFKHDSIPMEQEANSVQYQSDWPVTDLAQLP